MFFCYAINFKGKEIDVTIVLREMMKHLRSFKRS
jgi:hypothetical protein